MNNERTVFFLERALLALLGRGLRKFELETLLLLFSPIFGKADKAFALKRPSFLSQLEYSWDTVVVVKQYHLARL